MSSRMSYLCHTPTEGKKMALKHHTAYDFTAPATAATLAEMADRFPEFPIPADAVDGALRSILDYQEPAPCSCGHYCFRCAPNICMA